MSEDQLTSNMLPQDASRPPSHQLRPGASAVRKGMFAVGVGMGLLGSGEAMAQESETTSTSVQESTATTDTTAPAEILAPPVTEVREETPPPTAPPEILAPPQTVVRDTDPSTTPAVTEIDREAPTTTPSTEPLPSVNNTVDEEGQITNTSVESSLTSMTAPQSEPNRSRNNPLPTELAAAALVTGGALIADGARRSNLKEIQKAAAEKSRRIVDETPQS